MAITKRRNTISPSPGIVTFNSTARRRPSQSRLPFVSIMAASKAPATGTLPLGSAPNPPTRRRDHIWRPDRASCCAFTAGKCGRAGRYRVQHLIDGPPDLPRVLWPCSRASRPWWSNALCRVRPEPRSAGVRCCCDWKACSHGPVCVGSEADMCSAKRHVRFTPNSDRKSRHAQMVMPALPPKADMCGATAHVCYGPKADSCTAANNDRYSITSSAMANSEDGMVRPSAFAVLRLTIKSYLVGACTGISPGFSPLRMRSTYPAARRTGSWVFGP